MRPAFNSQIFASSEIDYFCREWVFVDHDVVGLEVPVQDAELLVEVPHADQYLLHDDAYFGLLVEAIGAAAASFPDVLR